MTTQKKEDVEDEVVLQADQNSPENYMTFKQERKLVQPINHSGRRSAHGGTTTGVAKRCVSNNNRISATSSLIGSSLAHPIPRQVVEQRPAPPKNVPKAPISGLPIAPVIQSSQNPHTVKKVVMPDGAPPKKKSWVLSD